MFVVRGRGRRKKTQLGGKGRKEIISVDKSAKKNLEITVINSKTTAVS